MKKVKTKCKVPDRLVYTGPMSKRISEASRYTVCYTCEGGTEQRFECTARDRGDALSQLQKQLGKATINVLRIVPVWLGRVGLK